MSLSISINIFKTTLIFVFVSWIHFEYHFQNPSVWYENAFVFINRDSRLNIHFISSHFRVCKLNFLKQYKRPDLAYVSFLLCLQNSWKYDTEFFTKKRNRFDQLPSHIHVNIYICQSKRGMIDINRPTLATGSSQPKWHLYRVCAKV